MQWHIPEEYNPQQHHCETIKIKKTVLPWLLKKFPTFYGNLKGHYHVHNTPQSISILYHTYPVHAFASCFSTIHFNITFSTKPKSCKWSPTNTWVVFSLFHGNPTRNHIRTAEYQWDSTDLSEAVNVRRYQCNPVCRDLVCWWCDQLAMTAQSRSFQVHLSAPAAVTTFQPAHAAYLPQSPPVTQTTVCNIRPQRTIWSW